MLGKFAMAILARYLYIPCNAKKCMENGCKRSRVLRINPVALGHGFAYSPTEFAALCGKSPTLLTKHEAARHLNVTPRYIERMVRAGCFFGNN